MSEYQIEKVEVPKKLRSSRWLVRTVIFFISAFGFFLISLQIQDPLGPKGDSYALGVFFFLISAVLYASSFITLICFVGSLIAKVFRKKDTQG